MNQSNSSPVLTILIPTRNRAKNLETTLRRIIKSIEYAKANDGKVEIVIVNNFSSDNTEEISKKWAEKYQYIKYYKHQQSYPSAEESLCNGIKYCNGEYVWSFGDDDYMYLDAVGRMLKVISLGKYNLIVQNFKFTFPNYPERGSYNYLQTQNNDDILMEYSGYNLFKEFGFWHLTAGFSLICFKKQKFKIDIFKEFIEISKIYSYSASLFSSFCNNPAAFLSKPLICMTQNTEDAEFSSISKVGVDSGFLPCFSWSNGFIKILNLISQKTGISLLLLSQAREIIFSRTSRIYHQSLVINNLTHHLIKALESIDNNKILTNRTSVRNLFYDYDQYFNSVDDAICGFKNIKKYVRKVLKILDKNKVLFFVLLPINLRSINRIIYKMRNIQVPEMKGKIALERYNKIINL